MTQVYFHCSNAIGVSIDRCGSAVADLAEAQAHAVLVVVEAPVPGDRHALLRDPVLEAEEAAQVADESGLAVDERVHVPGGEVEGAHRRDEALADAGAAAVEPGDVEVGRGLELLLLLGPLDLEEDVRAGAGVEAMVVAIDGTSDRPDGSTFHITWSLDPGREAKESNDVLRDRGWTAIDPVAVTVIPARF